MRAAGTEVILAVSFEPADWRTPRDDFRVMLGPQADSGR
jgi:hypothetical protein